MEDDKPVENNPEPPVDFEAQLDEIFTAEEFPTNARELISGAFSAHNDIAAETRLGLETANGDAMANLARIEEERDGLQAQLSALTQELALIKSDKFDELMNGGKFSAGADDNIADDPHDDDPDGVDFTPEDLAAKYTS